MLNKALLMLQDGTIFHGTSIGILGTATGELCFNTGMTGYQEIFTDPSYYGQMMVMAASHIGNYGTVSSETESEGLKITSLVCKSFSAFASRWGGADKLRFLFEKEGKLAVEGFDTRAIVRHIRHHGSMNAVLSTEILEVSELLGILNQVPSMEGLELSSKVSTKTIYSVGREDSNLKVVAVDYGIKKSILTQLEERGCFVKVFPMESKAADLLAEKPDGIFLSNGPGDPAAMPATVEQVSALIESGLPIFGICLGHQLLALSQGLSTVKMKNGHRGINHPVLNLETGKGEITSQNHGFVVSDSSIEGQTNVVVTHRHLNDGSLAGIRLKNAPAFSVQFHPEASPGPHDSRYLFDQFINQMINHKTSLK